MPHHYDEELEKEIITLKKELMKKWEDGWRTWRLWIKFLDGDF